MPENERELFAAWEAQFAARNGVVLRVLRAAALGLGTASALVVAAVLSAALAVATLTGLAVAF